MGGSKAEQVDKNHRQTDPEGGGFGRGSRNQTGGRRGASLAGHAQRIKKKKHLYIQKTRPHRGHRVLRGVEPDKAVAPKTPPTSGNERKKKRSG